MLFLLFLLSCLGQVMALAVRGGGGGIVAAAAACASDPAWERELASVETNLEICGKRCWGEPICVSECMTEMGKYSPACANCFGMLTGCTKDFCMSKCMFGKSDKCQACTTEYCLPKFESCAGTRLGKTRNVLVETS